MVSCYEHSNETIDFIESEKCLHELTGYRIPKKDFVQ
jgi:hypothetical protein